MSSEYEKLIDAARAVVVTGAKYFWSVNGKELVKEFHSEAVARDFKACLERDVPSDGPYRLIRLVVGEVSALPPASPAPAPAKGVRCWRNNKGDFAGTIDRQRWTGERMEDVHSDGTVTPAAGVYTVALAEKLVARGEWVECDDAPYVAPVVKESLTTAPPVAAPTPTAPRESAEQVAERIQLLNPYTNKAITAIITARDATFTAEVDAAKALIAHNVEVIAARDRIIRSLQNTLQGKDDAIAELEIDADAARRAAGLEVER